MNVKIEIRNGKLTIIEDGIASPLSQKKDELNFLRDEYTEEFCIEKMRKLTRYAFSKELYSVLLRMAMSYTMDNLEREIEYVKDLLKRQKTIVLFKSDIDNIINIIFK